MNYLHQCSLALLLITMVMAKMVTPVIQVYKSSLQADIEQQQQKTSEESGAEKADAGKAKTEVAELLFSQHIIAAHPAVCSLYHSYFISLLPSRYFAVPTPPPWYIS